MEYARGHKTRVCTPVQSSRRTRTRSSEKSLVTSTDFSDLLSLRILSPVPRVSYSPSHRFIMPIIERSVHASRRLEIQWRNKMEKLKLGAPALGDPPTMKNRQTDGEVAACSTKKQTRGSNVIDTDFSFESSLA